jgi:hypothetical protein
MVPVEGIEPPTFGLQNRCSTAELNRQNALRHLERHLRIFASPVNPGAVENRKMAGGIRAWPHAVAASMLMRSSCVTTGSISNHALKAGRA